MATTGGTAQGAASEDPAHPPRDDGGVTEGLLAAFTSLGTDLDSRLVLSRILEHACELTGASYGALAVVGEDGDLADLLQHGDDPSRRDRSPESAPGRRGPDLRSLGTEVLNLASLDEPQAHYGFPLDEPQMRTLLRIPVTSRGTASAHLFLTNKPDDAPFGPGDEQVTRALAGMAGFVLENARAHRLSESRRRWLESFEELSRALRPPIALDDAFAQLAVAARRATGAEACQVVRVPADGEPEVAATQGTAPPLDEEDRARLVATLRQVVSTGDVVHLAIGDGRVAVLAPLQAHLAVSGVLVAIHPRSHHPEDLEERDLLSSFADQAALALDRTQALVEREHLAVVSDRDRIARDLHDVVIQRLFATGLHMQSIRSAAKAAEVSGDLTQRIDQAVRDLDQTIRDVRGAIFELQTRPQASLRNEVRDLVREYVPLLGFAPSVRLSGPVDTTLEPQVQQQLVSALREALSNAARHARAGSVSVELQVSGAAVRLRVSDNGCGIPEDRAEAGLRSARRRAVMLGGSLDLWANDPSGTIFVWVVPLGTRG